MPSSAESASGAPPAGPRPSWATGWCGVIRARATPVEAARRSLAFAREVVKPPSLVSYIDPANAASIRVAEKLGATCTETIELLDHGPHRVYRHF